jgi:hypothetical protein
MDITEQYLNTRWEEFSKEQMRLMTEIKNDQEVNLKKQLPQQLTQINAIMMALMRLRNIRKKVAQSL